LPSSRVSRRLQDIIDNARAIADYTRDMDSTVFAENRMVYDATERCMERICEAAAKLGDMGPHLMPDQPWQKIRGLGNVLRHEYDDIDHGLLFEVDKTHIPALSVACETVLQKLGPEQEQAISEDEYYRATQADDLSRDRKPRR
jgi:uncharacterized protein with HEPN domain